MKKEVGIQNMLETVFELTHNPIMHELVNNLIDSHTRKLYEDMSEMFLNTFDTKYHNQDFVCDEESDKQLYEQIHLEVNQCLTMYYHKKFLDFLEPVHEERMINAKKNQHLSSHEKCPCCNEALAEEEMSQLVA